MSGNTSWRTRITRVAVTLSIAAGTLLVASPVASATDVVSAGPLTTITVQPDLACAVNHLGDYHGEWYAELACGTFVAVGGHLYGPAFIPAGSAATGTAGYVAYTPVSQTGVTGSGTAASPYVVTTVVDLGTSGVRLTETDSYVVGQESYRTTVKLSSSASGALTPIVYRAGDCYLQDSDYGLGTLYNGDQPVCKALPTSADPNRVEGLLPLTSGSHYMEGLFSDVWAAVGAQQSLPNTIRTADEHDNGIALSWQLSLAAGGTASVSSLAFFSPVGHAPVSLTKTADAATASANSQVGYTITATNPGVLPETLTSISDLLPAGFTYVAGSTTGVTTANPSVSGQTITWSGSFVVPAATATGPGTITLHFKALAPNVDGLFTNSATADCVACSVVDAYDTAPVTLSGATTSPSPSPTTTTTTTTPAPTTTTTTPAPTTTTTTTTPAPTTTKPTMSPTHSHSPRGVPAHTGDDVISTALPAVGVLIGVAAVAAMSGVALRRSRRA